MLRVPASRHRWRLSLWATLVMSVAALALAGCGGTSEDSETAPSGEHVQTVSAKIKPGQAQYFTYGTGKTSHQFIVYTPTSFTASSHMPLVILLHGCQTTAYQQMQVSQYNPVANSKKFVMVYPDTSPAENAQPNDYSRCWEYYHSADWHRGQGDGKAIAGITREVIKHWHINTQRVYVMGMSAGSFLSADLATEYPDIYAASGEASGGAYADYKCLYVYKSDSFTASQSASEAYKAEGKYARVVPRIVIGGSADPTVAPGCANKALAQSLRTNNLVSDHTQTKPIPLAPKSVRTSIGTAGKNTYVVTNYDDKHGCLVGQRYLVDGMGHLWSGGSKNPALDGFTDPDGPNAALASWNFFHRFTLKNTADPCS
jgi:poly(hydroxyalkanoate) depolymerase family esterase